MFTPTELTSADECADGEPEAAAPPTSVDAIAEDQRPSSDALEYGFSHLRQQVDELRSRLDTAMHEAVDAKAQVRREQALVQTLRAQIPSKADRQRTNKQLGAGKRDARQVENLTSRLEEVDTDRTAVVAERDDLRERLAEAINARARAEQKTMQLEARLSTPAGRAAYLRRSLLSEIDTLIQDVATARQGPDRSRAKRQLKELTALRDALDSVYSPDPTPCEPIPRIVVGTEHDVSLTPIGGGTEIGGSAMLFSAGPRRILIDAGMHPDGRGPAAIEQVYAEERLDAIIVTHAHNDHAGYIPALVNRFSGAQVICSQATAQLLPTMWSDSARVMERNFVQASDSAHAPSPLYGQAEVEYAESKIVAKNFHRTFRLGDVEVALFPAGHILGAAGVVLRAGERRVIVSGDVSGLDDRYLSVGGLHLPKRLAQSADLLVIESTYCHSDHGSRSAQTSELVRQVRNVVENRGRVLIPAFGLGRSQEIAMIVRDELPDVNVLIDGLAREISAIYETTGERLGSPCEIFAGNVRRVENRAREISTFHTGVIIASSGMLTGGASVQWAKSVLPDPNAALLLCGYQDEESPGRRLEVLTTSHQGRRTLFLPDDELGVEVVDVRAEVRKYSLSAHADRSGLAEIVNEIAPKATMLVHGEAHHQADFRNVLRQLSHEIVPIRRWIAP